MDTIMLLITIAVVLYVIFWVSKLPPADPEEVRKKREAFERQLATRHQIDTYGYISPAMICPHCQTKGQISTKPVKRKKGVSGAKVTGALLTFGVSMLATGLSRKEGLTQAHCGNCGSTWDF